MSDIEIEKLTEKSLPLSHYMGKLAFFSLPISANMLFNMISTFIAVLMVAKLGKASLAAVALAGSTFITLSVITSSIFYAVSILISHAHGQKKPTVWIGALIKNSFYLATLLAVPASFLLWNMGTVLPWLGQDPALAALTYGYFHFAGLSMFPMLISMVIIQFYMGIGNPKFTLYITLLSLPFLIILSYALILGKLGMPQLGVSGITLAIFIVTTLRCIIILFYMFLVPSLKKYHLFTGSWRLDLQLCQRIIKLGLPIGIQFGGELAAMTCATYLMGQFGVTALAAAQIVSQYSMLGIMIVLGLSQAVSVLVSKSYGEHDIYAIKHYFNAGFVLQILLFLVIGFVYYTLPMQLASLYVDIQDPHNQLFLHLVRLFFAVSAVSLWFDSIRNFLAGGLRGIHDSKTPMVVGLVGLWAISLPTAYFIGFICKGGPVGLQIGFACGFLIASVVLWWRSKNKLMLLEFEK